MNGSATSRYLERCFNRRLRFSMRDTSFAIAFCIIKPRYISLNCRASDPDALLFREAERVREGFVRVRHCRDDTSRTRARIIRKKHTCANNWKHRYNTIAAADNSRRYVFETWLPSHNRFYCGSCRYRCRIWPLIVIRMAMHRRHDDYRFILTEDIEAYDSRSRVMR